VSRQTRLKQQEIRLVFSTRHLPSLTSSQGITREPNRDDIASNSVNYSLAATTSQPLQSAKLQHMNSRRYHTLFPPQCSASRQPRMNNNVQPEDTPCMSNAASSLPGLEPEEGRQSNRAPHCVKYTKRLQQSHDMLLSAKCPCHSTKSRRTCAYKSLSPRKTTRFLLRSVRSQHEEQKKAGKNEMMAMDREYSGLRKKQHRAQEFDGFKERSVRREEGSTEKATEQVPSGH
jgi:hypothetical protein